LLHRFTKIAARRPSSSFSYSIQLLPVVLVQARDNPITRLAVFANVVDTFVMKTLRHIQRLNAFAKGRKCVFDRIFDAKRQFVLLS